MRKILLVLAALMICQNSWGLGRAHICRNVFINLELFDVTSPSMEPFQKPQGVQADAQGSLSLFLENVSAKVLARFGFELIQNPLDVGDGALRKEYIQVRKNSGLSSTRTADYYMEGRIFDNYAPEKPSLNNVVKGILQKVKKGQTKRVIVNLMKHEGFQKGLWNIRDLIDEIKIRNPSDLLEVIVITGSESKPWIQTVFPVRHYLARPLPTN